MSEKTLQLVFDPALRYDPFDATRTVVCVQQTTDQTLPGESLKEFCGPSYASLGREVGLWWYRRFTTPGREVKALHDLFRWKDLSALWFTRNLFLYEDYGIFATSLSVARSLELFDAGEIGKVRIIGNRPDLEEVFALAGFPCEVVHTTSPKASRSNLFSKSVEKIRGLYRRFYLSRRFQKEFAENHRSGQADTLLYSVVQGEWNPSGHRYLQDTIDELMEMEEIDSVRPIVYGIPPAFEDDREWSEFLDYSLRKRGGVYPMADLPISEFRAIRGWVAERMMEFQQWRAEAPEAFKGFRDWDFSPLIQYGLADLAGQLERGLSMAVAIQKCLERIRPKGLLIKDEVYPHGRILTAAARWAGVPTFSLQHGSIYPTHWCYLIDPEATGLAQPPLPDGFGVYGSAIADLLADRNGFPRDILKVVGARRFQELDRMTPSQEFSDLKAEGKPLILVAGQLHQDMPKVYSWLFTLAERSPQLNFVFKPHPRDREGVEAVQSKCTELSNSRMFQGPIGDILPACDLVVSCHSTVLLEAVWLGIGGISVLVSDEPADDWREKAGLIKVVRSIEDLERNFTALTEGTLFSDGDRDAAEVYLEEYLGLSFVKDRSILRGIF